MTTLAPGTTWNQMRARLVRADPGAGPSRSGTIGIVDNAPATAPRPGQPRSQRDAALLARFDARMQLPIVVSAILPLVIVPAGDEDAPHNR